jgi:hypothetical protein
MRGAEILSGRAFRGSIDLQSDADGILVSYGVPSTTSSAMTQVGVKIA